MSKPETIIPEAGISVAHELPATARRVRVDNEPTPEQRKEVMAERERRWKEYEAVHGSGNGAAEAQPDDPVFTPATPPEPIEDVDHVELTLPNGMEIEYGPRPGTNLSWDVAEMLGDKSNNAMLSMLCRSALCVRSINGKPMRKPANEIEARAVANKLGEQGLDMLFLVHNQIWRPVQRQDLPQIRKVFR